MSEKKLHRIDKILAHMGFGTRSEVKKLARQGRITLNGEKVNSSAVLIDPAISALAVDGKKVFYREFVYLMMNKPPGVISATEDKRERTVIDLLPPEWQHFDIFPVGRLDKDTVGLLLLTNDGPLSHSLLSPRRHVIKKYYAEVEGQINQSDIDAFHNGIILDDDYKTLPASLQVISNGEKSIVEIDIQEGKFHQVKRMLAVCGKQVIFLKRLTMGSLKLDPTLAPGEWRELTEEELADILPPV